MKHSKYFDYIEKHRDAVQYVWEHQLKPVLQGWGQDPDQIDIIDRLIEEHDMSKFSPSEFAAYENYFYREDTSDRSERELDEAWCHHIHANKHHWQYWVIIQDDDGQAKPINMPFEYICEMICDWQSFSLDDPNNTAMHYYESHKDAMVISEYTKTTIEALLHYLDKHLGDNK